tara:strand:+ start:279 stop:581 length:303 start_codon:yes stop_codon:yes gene_type:complete
MNNKIYNIFEGFKIIIKGINNIDDFISLRDSVIPFARNDIEKELILSIKFNNSKYINYDLYFKFINDIINKNNVDSNYKNIIDYTNDHTQLKILNHVINK